MHEIKFDHNTCKLVQFSLESIVQLGNGGGINLMGDGPTFINTKILQCYIPFTEAGGNVPVNQS